MDYCQIMLGWHEQVGHKFVESMPAQVYVHKAKGGQTTQKKKTCWVNVKSSWDDESAGFAQTCRVHASSGIVIKAKGEGAIAKKTLFIVKLWCNYMNQQVFAQTRGVHASWSACSLSKRGTNNNKKKLFGIIVKSSLDNESAGFRTNLWSPCQVKCILSLKHNRG